MEGVDLNQPAKVLWWDSEELAAKGDFKWGGTERTFGALRDAINFVRGQGEVERSTAMILFDSPPGTLDFRKPKSEENAREMLQRS